MIARKLAHPLLLAGLLASAGVLSTACSDDDPVEAAAEDADDAMEEAGDTIEDAAEDAKDAAEDAADELDDETSSD
jgi:hypothetical protein